MVDIISLAHGVAERIGEADVELAPESNQKWGKQSTAYLQKKIGGKSVKVEWRERDRYGRILGTVYMDGENINLEMVKSGNARQYHYSKDAAISAAQNEAKAAKRGLWSQPSPIDPWEWRKQTK